MQEQIALSKRKELLEKHPFRIWEGRNGSWYTYLPGENSKQILKKRSTTQSIEDFVCDYWKWRRSLLSTKLYRGCETFSVNS